MMEMQEIKQDTRITPLKKFQDKMKNAQKAKAT